MSERSKEPLPDEPVRAGSKKDTKHACAGKKGREHQYVWRPVSSTLTNDWNEQVCTSCGKKVGICFGGLRCHCGKLHARRGE